MCVLYGICSVAVRCHGANHYLKWQYSGNVCVFGSTWLLPEKFCSCLEIYAAICIVGLYLFYYCRSAEILSFTERLVRFGFSVWQNNRVQTVNEWWHQNSSSSNGSSSNTTNITSIFTNKCGNIIIVVIVFLIVCEVVIYMNHQYRRAI